MSDEIIVLDDDIMMPKVIGSITGKKVHSFANPEDIWLQEENLHPDAIFVDIHLGLKETGLDVLPKLKDRWPYAPIIVMTAKRGGDVIGEALASGASDFVYKPIDSRELIARTQARTIELRQREAKEVLEVSDIKVDLLHCTFKGLSKSRYISSTEMALFSCLLEAKGNVVQRDVLKRRCWGQIYVSDNALNRKLHELRRALSDVTVKIKIETVYGVGFSLTV